MPPIPHREASTSTSSARSSTSSSSSSTPSPSTSTSTTRPPLLPSQSKPEPPALTRVFARGQQRRGTKSAMGSLPRPSPLRKQVSFGDGLGNGNGNGNGNGKEEDKGKKRAVEQEVYTAGVGAGEGGGSDEPNKRAKIVASDAASVLSSASSNLAPSASMPVAAAPALPALASAASGSGNNAARSWWSWSSPNLAAPPASEQQASMSTLPPNPTSSEEPQGPDSAGEAASAAGHISPPATSAASSLLAASSSTTPSASSSAGDAPPSREDPTSPSSGSSQRTVKGKRSWFGSWGRAKARQQLADNEGGSVAPPVPPLPAGITTFSSSSGSGPTSAGSIEAPGIARMSSEASAASAPPNLQSSSTSSPTPTPTPAPPSPQPALPRRPSSPIPIPIPSSSSTLTPPRQPQQQPSRPTHSRQHSTASRLTACAAGGSSAPSTPAGRSSSIMTLESPDTRVPTPAFLRAGSPVSVSSLPASGNGVGEQGNPASGGGNYEGVQGTGRAGGAGVVSRLVPAPSGGLASLNAGALRYTLSLPLLGGRPKRMEVVTLGEGEGEVNGKGGRSQREGAAGEGGGVVIASGEGVGREDGRREERVEVMVVPPTPGQGGGKEAEKGKSEVDPTAEQAAAEAAWWWSYLGFSNPSKPPPSASDPVAPAPPAAPSDSEAADILPPLSPSFPSHHSPQLQLQQQQQSDTPRPSSASVFSGETSKTKGGSVWYQPWYWYTAPAAPAQEEDRDEEGKTEAERVKDEALARASQADPPPADSTSQAKSDESPQQPQQDKDQDQDTAGVPANPLTSASNMPMWINFFSAGRNPARAAVNQHEEMEVMTIDEDGPSDSASPSSSATAAAAPGVGSPGSAVVVVSPPVVEESSKDRKKNAAKEAAKLAGQAKEAVRARRSQSRDGLKAAAPTAPAAGDVSKLGSSLPKDGLKPGSVPSSKPGSIKAGTSPSSSTLPAPTATSATGSNPSGKPSEPPKDAPAPPLTINPKPKKALENKRAASINSKKDKSEPAPPVPNFLLPTFQDVFYHPPLSIRPPEPENKPSGALKKMGRYVNKFLGQPPTYGPVLVDPELAEYQRRLAKGKGREGEEVAPGTSPTSEKRQQERMKLEGMPALMPRSWAVMGMDRLGEMRHVKRAVIIGVHGWFPGAMIRSVLGEPTGTSGKFVQMQRDALLDYLQKHDIKLDSVTEIPLEGEGTIQHRLDKLYGDLTANEAWMSAIHEADIILFATHSQGSIVTCHIMDRLLGEGHIHTGTPAPSAGEAIIKMETEGPSPPRKVQRVVCLALCGIHLGPLLYLNTSVLTQPWIRYLESQAALELFEFQDTESEVSKRYVTALARVLDHGCKFVYIASLNDQVVPIYSGAFVNASHPLILRALYIDGDAYSSSDFLTNLLVLCLRLRNAGLTDGGLVVHLSEATAGSLNGVGHSTAYEEMACYTLAVRYLFETNHSPGALPPLELEPFSARESRNDYEIPWILNELVTHPAVQEWFLSEIEELRAAFDDWKPKTAALRDIRRKLEPIKRKGRGLNRIVIGPSRL